MRRFLQPVAPVLAILLACEIALPTVMFALTGGPAQPEFSGFTAVSTSDMVNPFTGDLTYNIPLMDVDGYPVNLAYHSGTTMDAEASWVGLGWNLNMGVINRTMRGLPDDFNGDAVIKESNIKANRTWGVKVGYGREIFGLKKGSQKQKKAGEGMGSLDFNFGIFRNSYTGYGFEFGPSIGVSAAYKGFLKGGLGLGLGFNSHEGISQSINASLSAIASKADKAGDEFVYSAGTSVSTSYNSRSGLKALSVGVTAGASTAVRNKAGERETAKLSATNGDATIPTGSQSYTPQVQMPMRSVSGRLRITVGDEWKGRNQHGSIEGYFSRQELASKLQGNPGYGYFYSQNAGPITSLLDFNREKDGTFTEKTPNLPVSNVTYDMFTASGHGVSGMFRPFRGDVGILSDPYQRSGGTGDAGGVE
ncbi:MAG TPA: hypothetical protein VNA88_06875, partial [Candidatus Kapabacteria bacterium]|nr:hypothetical protein [Candidatus Kapabacteria bacterium]